MTTYCSFLFCNSLKYLVDRLQKVQNHAARLVMKARKNDHATPLLHTLHWLPVSYRIQYKILSLCYTSLSGDAPVYLSELLHLYTPSRQLRSSSDTRILRLPRMNTKTFGQRSFVYQAPLLWNSLPAALRLTVQESSFRKDLKTYLFRSAYFK